VKANLGIQGSNIQQGITNHGQRVRVDIRKESIRVRLSR